MKRSSVQEPAVPPTDEELAAALPAMRGQLRRHAAMFDNLADIAADAGTMQSSLRGMARVLRERADALEFDDFDPEDYRLRCDVVAVSLLCTTIDAGYVHWAEIGNTISETVRNAMR